MKKHRNTCDATPWMWVSKKNNKQVNVKSSFVLHFYGQIMRYTPILCMRLRTSQRYIIVGHRRARRTRQIMIIGFLFYFFVSAIGILPGDSIWLDGWSILVYVKWVWCWVMSPDRIRVYRVLQDKCDKFERLILQIKIHTKFIQTTYGLILNNFGDFCYSVLFIEISSFFNKKYYNSLLMLYMV